MEDIAKGARFAVGFSLALFGMWICWQAGLLLGDILFAIFQ